MPFPYVNHDKHPKRWKGIFNMITHVVRPGETLGEIAARYGTTVEAIMRANGLHNYWIYPGELLRIPRHTYYEHPAPHPVYETYAHPAPHPVYETYEHPAHPAYIHPATQEMLNKHAEILSQHEQRISHLEKR